MTGAARIGTLRVATRDGAGTVTARALIEDALRVSGADADRGLLVVRRLEAGPMDGRSGVAVRMSLGLAEARARAVRADAPGASAADAVLFRDEAEPYLLYADALARGLPLADAWFFRSIFRIVVTPEPEPAFAALLTKAASEPFAAPLLVAIFEKAGAVAVRALRHLGEQESLQIAGALSLRAAVRRGIRTTVTGRSLEKLRAAPRSIMQEAMAVSRSAGSHDPITLIAAAVVLHAAGVYRPDREDVSATAALLAAGALVRQEAVAEISLVEDSLLGPAGQSPGQSAQDATSSIRVEDAAVRGEPDPESGKTAVVRESRRDGSAKLVEERADAEPKDSMSQETETPVRGQASSRATKSAADGPPASVDVPVKNLVAQGSPSTPGTGRNGDAPAQPDDVPAKPEAAHARPTSDAPGWRGEQTAWAGATLLVGLAARLLPGLLHGVARSHDVGRWVLDTMLSRAGCPETDPARRAFGLLDRSRSLAETMELDVLAALDLAPMGAALAIHPVTQAPGWRALTVLRGRLTIAVWQGRMPEHLRAAVADRGARRAGPVSAPVSSVLLAAELTMRRAIREITGRPARDLVARSGWIAASRTHVDATFDSTLVDIAVRRAGLDIDPGWCAWLGRVVSIHYDYGDCNA